MINLTHHHVRTFECRYAKQRALQRADALKANVRVVKQQPTPVLALLLQSLFSTQVSDQLWQLQALHVILVMDPQRIACWMVPKRRC